MMFKRRKVSWSDHDRRGVCEGEENCLKDLKRGVEQKRGEGKQRFKKVGESRVKG